MAHSPSDLFIKKEAPTSYSRAEDFHRAIDRLFETFFSSATGHLPMAKEPKEFLPPMDLSEIRGQIFIEVDLPGVSKSDINLELKENELVISGERKKEKNDEQEGRPYQECSYGNFRRLIPLPYNVDADEIEAAFENGVLRISFPKPEQQSSRKISIKEGAGQRNESISLATDQDQVA